MIAVGIVVVVAIGLFIIGAAVYDEDTVQKYGRAKWRQEQEQSYRDRTGQR